MKLSNLETEKKLLGMQKTKQRNVIKLDQMSNKLRFFFWGKNRVNLYDNFKF